jgi:hypothetical protein
MKALRARQARARGSRGGCAARAPGGRAAPRGGRAAPSGREVCEGLAFLPYTETYVPTVTKERAEIYVPTVTKNEYGIRSAGEEACSLFLLLCVLR